MCGRIGRVVGFRLPANYTDSICLATKQTPETTAIYKFWFVFAVNGGLSVFWKDPGLAKIFGSGPPKKTPKSVYAAWCARDVLD